MIRSFVVKIAVNSLAIWVADYFLNGFEVRGGFKAYLLAGLLLAILNTFIRPVLKLLTFPLIALSLGLFTVIINATILWFVGHYLEAVVISGLATLFWATFIVTLVNIFFDRPTDD